MNDSKKLIVSHAPFWHNGSSVAERSLHITLAAVPAALWGCFQYGMPAVGVISLSITFAMFWELVINKAMRKPVTIADGNAVMFGLLFGMLMPAVTPWWLVLVGTFLVIIVGKQIYGGIGSYPFHPIAVSIAILAVSWGKYLDFDAALVNYDLGFTMAYPLGQLKAFGMPAIESFTVWGLLTGQQVGGIGATFGLGLIAGGVYLILRGFIRWEISLSFLGGVFITALIFHAADPARFAGPLFHLFTGYTLIGAFFIATEDSSSPVNVIPMFIYGAAGGLLTVLIRNIGAWVDGVILAILVVNTLSPLLDKIRPKALGKVV